MITDLAQHVANEVVVAIPRFQMDRNRLLRLSWLPAKPDVAKRGDEVTAPVDIIGRETRPVIPLPENETVPRRVVIRARLLPCRSKVVIIDSVVVAEDRPCGSCIHHGRRDVLENVVFNQIVRGHELLGAVAL